VKRKKVYVTAAELSEILGISVGHSYRLIKRMNEELAKKNFIVIAGKVPRKYVEEQWYGFGA
jgi:fructose-1-phosphate kinase PfkB-like protein